MADWAQDLREVELRPLSTDEWPVPWEPVEGNKDGFVEHASYAAVRAIVGGAALLPDRVVHALLGGLARVAARVDRKRSSVAAEFIDQAVGPGLSERELGRRVHAAWRHLFRVVFEAEVLGRRIDPEHPERHFTIEVCEEVARLRETGQGCVIVTPHVGNWEAAMAVAPRLGLGRLYAVARPPRNRPMSIATQRSRERFGARILHRNGAMKSLAKLVRAGATVCLLLDQRGRGRSVVAPYFGRPALCERSAGVLLRRIGAPVVFGACYLTDEPFRYRLRLERLVTPEELAGLSPEELATVVNRAMEELVLARPEQYFWLHDRYRGAPDELPAAAEPEPAPGPPADR